MNWKFFAQIGIGYIRGAGEKYKAEDSNNTGSDDLKGIALCFAADLVESIIQDKEFPKVPTVLK